MKKISNSIRIGMVPRGNISPKISEEHLPSNDQGQQFNTHNNHGIYTNDPVHDHQQHIPTFTSPTNVRINHVKEINTSKQPTKTNGLRQHPSSPSTRLGQDTASDLHEVPAKANRWSTKKKILVGTSAAVLAVLAAVSIVLGVLLTRTAATATASTSSTTTVAPTIITAFWSFDTVPTDLYGVYNGTTINGATYSPVGSTTVPYFGNTQALVLNSTSSQWFSVSSTFLPLNFTSFTIEAWIYPVSIAGDRGIFGQCACSTCANQCLYFICRAGRLYIGFSLNDLSGVSTLGIPNWYHVAFVYNYQTQQQILYLNGVQDAIKSNAAPYQGNNGSIQIGSTQVFPSVNYFSGTIDNVLVTTRVKSSVEILSDASLVLYYPFDLPNPFVDNGPNRFVANSTNVVTIGGRVNQAMRFFGAGSFVQVYGLYQIVTGTVASKPFSISMWINPTSVGSFTFVQLMPTIGVCSNLLGVYSSAGSTGQIVVQSTGAQASITGPYVSQNVWTHISLTYSTGNGYTLYYNGVYFGANGVAAYYTSNIFTSLYIGFSTNCAGGGQNTGYQGAIDEVYVHNRELTQTDVTALANP